MNTSTQGAAPLIHGTVLDLSVLLPLSPLLERISPLVEDTISTSALTDSVAQELRGSEKATSWSSNFAIHWARLSACRATGLAARTIQAGGRGDEYFAKVQAHDKAYIGGCCSRW